MDATGLPIFQAIKQRMSWLMANQKVISENVANADTPGYKAKTLQQADFSGLVDMMSQDSARGPRSIKAPRAPMGVDDGRPRTEKIKDAEVTGTGNSVVLEEEMLKLANNQMEYGLAVQLYKKHAGLLKTALGKTG